MLDRPGWDEYFSTIALAVARRGDCTRAQVGAVIVKDNRIVSTGYNGAPAGERGCLSDRACPRGHEPNQKPGGDYSNCIALHAEQNAIAYANGEQCRGATMYVTYAPCDMCSKLIRAAGIERIVVS